MSNSISAVEQGRRMQIPGTDRAMYILPGATPVVRLSERVDSLDKKERLATEELGHKLAKIAINESAKSDEKLSKRLAKVAINDLRKSRSAVGDKAPKSTKKGEKSKKSKVSKNIKKKKK